MAIPKAPVKRIIQEAGAERVSADAVDVLVEFLEDYAEDVSKKAVVYTKYANRKTVKAEDIDLAVGSSKTSESPNENKHNILDVIKDVFDAASEGKGIEDIIKSFKKMEKK
jgi:histone H3/H4